MNLRELMVAKSKELKKLSNNMGYIPWYNNLEMLMREISEFIYIDTATKLLK